MTDQEFHFKSDEALAALDRALARAADEHGFEVDSNAGALTVEFEDPHARFVVSPNSPVKQIWVSALNKSFKLDFDAAKETIVLRHRPDADGANHFGRRPAVRRVDRFIEDGSNPRAVAQALCLPGRDSSRPFFFAT